MSTELKVRVTYLSAAFIVMTALLTAKASLANSTETPTIIQLAQSRPPRPSRLPAGSVSGATRRSCQLENSPLAAADNNIYHLFSDISSEPAYSGYTATSSPQFWVYVPYSLHESSPIRFKLKRADTRETVYDSKVIVGRTSGGLVGLNAPVALEQNVAYLWSLYVYCNDAELDRKPQSVTGSVMFIPESERSLSERWYDRLNSILLDHQQNPEDPMAAAVLSAMIEAANLQDFPLTSEQTSIIFPTLD